MNSRDLISEYESRMRALERELEEKRWKNLCQTENEKLKRELEDTERIRRQEAELMRFKALQDEARYRHRIMLEEQSRYQERVYMERGLSHNNHESYQLKLLQEQIRQQELENERLKRQIQTSIQVSSSSNSLQKQYDYTQYQTPNIYVTQNASVPNRPSSIPIKEVNNRNTPLDLSDKDQNETFVEVKQPPKVLQPSFKVNEFPEAVIKPRRLTFTEAYELLSTTQKKFCDGLRAYACAKSGAKESLAKYHLSIGNAQKNVIKFMIKNGTTVTLFRLEDERLRRLRRTATSDGAEIKVKETELAILDNVSFQTAKEMIDLRLIQIEEDKEYQKIRAYNRRKGIKE